MITCSQQQQLERRTRRTKVCRTHNHILRSASSTVTETSPSSAEFTLSNDVDDRYYYQLAKEEHDAEIKGGLATFGDIHHTNNNNPKTVTDSTTTTTKTANTINFDEYFHDDNNNSERTNKFFSLNVGKGNAGTDEDKLYNGQCIHGTIQPLFTPEECEELIQEARNSIATDLRELQLQQQNGGGDGDNNKEGDKATSSPPSSSFKPSGRRAANCQLGEAKVSNLPQALSFLKDGDVLKKRLYPLLSNRFFSNDTTKDDNSSSSSSSSCVSSIEDLVVYDALIIGHVGPSRSQPLHRDSSFLTINVALSKMDGYDDDSGGTYFEALVLNNNNGDNQQQQQQYEEKEMEHTIRKAYRTGVVKMDQGHALCHAGGVMHAGLGINKGERWLMVLFVLSKKEIQIARRLHAIGVRLKTGYDNVLVSDKQEDDEDDEKQKMLVSMMKQRQKESYQAFVSGWKQAPNDHLLITSIGSLHYERGDVDTAEQCLQLAIKYYPICPKAAMSLCNMYTENDHPQQQQHDDDNQKKSKKRKLMTTMKIYDDMLKRIGTSDLQTDWVWQPMKALAWNVRMNSAQCALAIAELEWQRYQSSLHMQQTQQYHQQQRQHEVFFNRGKIWTKARLPDTIKLLKIVLQPLKGEQERKYVESMICTAENYLMKYDNEA